VIKTVTKDVTTLAAGALFKFDRRGEADMLPAGKAQLDEFAQKLAKVYERVISVTVVGHADRLGEDGYNAKLSLDRANTVSAYLKSKGVAVPMSSSGKGESEPVVQCEGTKPTPELTACLQPNRRVEIEVLGIKR
jgi:outer membrane protein OmpA-like peptidoglycan-associated protein